MRPMCRDLIAAREEGALEFRPRHASAPPKGPGRAVDLGVAGDVPCRAPGRPAQGGRTGRLQGRHGCESLAELRAAVGTISRSRAIRSAALTALRAGRL